jgi:adenosylmethionine---8-amino-7-oxononanoate aminotransferase
MSRDYKSEDLRQIDLKHVWHPFTPHSVYPNEAPLMVSSGEGNYLIDVYGNRYLDGVSSLWCNLFGHNHPKITKAIEGQLKLISHSTFLGNTSVPATILAKKLVDIAPKGLSRVFYSDNAVEVAVKMAYQYWQQVKGGRDSKRKRFISLSSAYHGDTIGSVSIGGIDLFHERYRPLLFSKLTAPSPYSYRRPEGVTREEFEARALSDLLTLISDHAEELAAVVMEPVFQGAAGMVRVPEGFLSSVRRATRDAGCLLIVDEVAVGFGRTGRMFACEHENVSPDFLCLAKGLTGGYLPMAATLTTEVIFDAFLGPPEEAKTFFHGHTYTGNQLAASAALATLNIFEEERVLESLPDKIAYFNKRVQKLWELPTVGDIRQFGLIAGVELVRDKLTRAPFAPAERRGMRVCLEARKKGLFLRPLGDVIILIPPLSITFEEIDLLVEGVSYGIKATADHA